VLGLGFLLGGDGGWPAGLCTNAGVKCAHKFSADSGLWSLFGCSMPSLAEYLAGSLSPPRSLAGSLAGCRAGSPCRCLAG
jgi:hypothetical protein